MTGQHPGSGDGRHHRTRRLRPPQEPPPPPQGMPPPPGPPPSEASHPPQRIPAPHPTAAAPQEAGRAARKEAQRLYAQEQKEAEVPSWRGDVLRVLGCSAGCALLVWLLILLVRWRLLRDNSLETIEDTDTWTAILAMLISLMLPFVLLAPKRPDLGFRYGAVPFLPQIAVVAGAVSTVGMLAWPWLVGDDLVPGTVLAELTSDPVALVTAAALVFTWTCVFLLVIAALLTSFMEMKWVVGTILVLPFLGAIFGAGFTSVRTFDGPASMSACLVWVLLGFVALLLLTAMDALRNHLRRRVRHRDARQQAAALRGPGREEPGWNRR